MGQILTAGWLPKTQIGSQYFVDWSCPLSFGLKYVHCASNIFLQPTWHIGALGTFAQRNTGQPISKSIGLRGVGLGGTGTASGLQWVGGAPTLQSSPTSGGMTALCYVTVGFACNSSTNFRFLFRIDHTDNNSLLLFKNN